MSTPEQVTETTPPSVVNLICQNKGDLDFLSRKVQLFLITCIILLVSTLACSGIFYWKYSTTLTQIGIDTHDFVTQLQNQKRINDLVNKELSRLNGTTTGLDGRVIKLETVVFAKNVELEQAK